MSCLWSATMWRAKALSKAAPFCFSILAMSAFCLSDGPVGGEHLSIGLHVVALAVLLGELAHLDLGVIPLNGLGDEFLAGLVLPESGRGHQARERGADDQRFLHGGLPVGHAPPTR